MCEAKENKLDYLVLVNEDSRIPEGFTDAAEMIWTENMAGNRFMVEKKTFDAYCRLSKDVLENDGLETVLLGSYRTVERQKEIFERNVSRYGLDYTSRYTAKPGCSEHHTGLAIDVSILVDGELRRGKQQMLDMDHLFAILQKKLPKYGFILRYPKDKEPITRISYEPWHFRYIDSPELAQEITDRGICFEEYWAERNKK